MENNFQIDWIELSKLKPDPENTNRHPKDQIERLAKIIEYQGWRHPIIATKDNVIRAGEGRYLAAKKLKLKKVPVCYQDFKDDDQLRSFVTSDNAIASWAELDLAMINSQVGDFDPSFDIDLLGLKDFTIDIAERLEPQIDEDEVPEPAEPVCKPGDLWILGEHRLLCGDSTNIQHVERLMNGEKADMVFTDPPYGVDYDGGAQTKRSKLSNDQKGTSIYSDVLPLLKATTQNDASFYIWHSAGYADMAQTLWGNGFEIRSQIIWNKNQAQFGALSAQYKQKHEPCFYCFKKGNKPNWSGPTNEVTVWDLDRGKKNEFHPTQKPVELAERAIKNHKAPKVLDLFGGSGSTLIACEKTNRKCFMMELDPHYCDVIVNRWEKYTGKKAVLDGQDQEKD